MEDKRSVKTKRVIKEAFFSLLKEKPLNKITVAELSRLADLGRGTFYLHYHDVYDLYEQIEKDLFYNLDQFFNLSDPYCNPENFINLVDTVTKYISANKELFLLLFCPSESRSNLQKLKNFFIEKFLTQEDTPAMSEFSFTEILFAVSGSIGILEQWLNDDLRMPAEEIATMLHQILSKFL